MAIIDKSKKRMVVDRDDQKFIGIDMPLRLSPDSGSGYFAQTSTTLEAVRNNVKNLLNTEKGERLLQPTLGLNLRKFLFEQTTSDTIITIQNEISETFQRWLPFVNIENIEIDNSMSNRIDISIDFSVLNDPNTLSSVQVKIGE